jgi:hypothetical protein
MCNARVRGGNCTGFWWESPKEKDHLKDQGTDGKIGDWFGDVEWVHLAKDRDRFETVVNAVTNLRVLAPRGWLVSRNSSKFVFENFRYFRNLEFFKSVLHKKV